MRLSPHRQSGFTLIELMTAVVITGILAAVAIPAYTKYIRTSRTTEGMIKLREAYGAEYVYGMMEAIVRVGGTDVSCTRVPRFGPLMMLYKEGTTYVMNLPEGRKERGLYYSVGAGSDFTYAGGKCTGGFLRGFFGSPVEMGLASQYYPITPTYGVTESFEPGYFMIRAKPDPTIGLAYGVDDNDTLTIWALADLDGDQDIAPFFNSPWDMAVDDYKKMTVLARSIYFKDGKVLGAAGVVKDNVGE